MLDSVINFTQCNNYMPCNVVLYQFNGQITVSVKLLPEHTDNKEFDRLQLG